MLLELNDKFFKLMFSVLLLFVKTQFCLLSQRWVITIYELRREKYSLKNVYVLSFRTLTRYSLSNWPEMIFLWKQSFFLSESRAMFLVSCVGEKKQNKTKKRTEIKTKTNRPNRAWVFNLTVFISFSLWSLKKYTH